MSTSSRTHIRRRTGAGTGDWAEESVRTEESVGYLDADGTICKLRWGEGQPVGRVDEQGRVFRRTTHDERELGVVEPDGSVRSHGLFEGGAIGWTDPDGVVVQAGLIMGEEEVGSVDGPRPYAAGAALLLLFLPEIAEENRRHQ